METIIVRNGDHFHEEGFVSHAKFLSEENYAMVLDNAVITCVDICVINTKKQILLGKRTWYPHPDWWIIGGRMKPGESFNEAASRNIKRELQLDISPERFKRLWEYSMTWAKRVQSPEENGCHTVSITMMLKISLQEELKIKFNEEYETILWTQLHYVENHTSFHPVLHVLANKLIQRLFV